MNLADVHTVLVPVDFSDPSLEALRSGAPLVADGGTLHVLHVLPELHPLDPAVAADLTPALRIQRATTSLRDKLEELGQADATAHVRIGDPGRTIVQLARDLPADLVVISSHGYTGMKHLLLGSVAERVVRRAPCPVLVLRQSGA